MKKASAYANANIALVKYWGKSHDGFNIPAMSSLSMTLKDFGCEVLLSPIALAHEVIINGNPAPVEAKKRTAQFLEQLRRHYPYQGYFRVSSQTAIPYASGLASSAAYFASLIMAFTEALALDIDEQQLSILARMGSGSAARSIFGGFAALEGGPALCHEEAFAYPVAIHKDLKLHLVLAVVDQREKPVSSRDAMKATSKTSPFFPAFVASHQQDFIGAKTALADGNFLALGQIMEHSTLKMFATMWTAQPAIMYWQPHSLAIIEAIKNLRQEHGPIAFFTMDAGPNVKILCEENHRPLVVHTLAKTGFTSAILCALPGEGARVVHS